MVTRYAAEVSYNGGTVLRVADPARQAFIAGKLGKGALDAGQETGLRHGCGRTDSGVPRELRYAASTCRGVGRIQAC
jgi:tRNA U38,U39,U40 pseudouridine synthase TruA